jgi:hypothetical protein
MRTRSFMRRGVLPLSCLALLTIGTSAGRPQAVPVQVPPPIRGDLPPIPSLIQNPIPPLVDDPLPQTPRIKSPTIPAATVPAQALAIEDVIRQLEQIRKQKADLERQEKEVVARLQEMVKEQTDRLNKLGVGLPPPRMTGEKEVIRPTEPFMPGLNK